MKEYKVTSWKMGISNNNQRLEDALNQYALQGWRVLQVTENFQRIIFERDKNR